MGEGWFIAIMEALLLGIIGNYLFSYLKPHTDKWLGRFSERRRVKNAKTKEEFNRQLEKMLADPIEVLLVEQERNHALTHMLLGLILALGGFWLYTDTHGNELFALLIILLALGTMLTTGTRQPRQQYGALVRQYRKLKIQRDQKQANE